MNELNIPTSKYTFLNNYEEVKNYYEDIRVVVEQTVIKFDCLPREIVLVTSVVPKEY